MADDSAPGIGLSLDEAVVALVGETTARELLSLSARLNSLRGRERLTRSERLEADRLDTDLGLLFGESGALGRAALLLRVRDGALHLGRELRRGHALPAALALLTREARAAALLAEEAGRGEWVLPTTGVRPAAEAMARCAELTAAAYDLSRESASWRRREIDAGLTRHLGALRRVLWGALARGLRDNGVDAAAAGERDAVLEALMARLASPALPRRLRVRGVLELYGLAAAGAAGEGAQALDGVLASVSDLVQTSVGGGKGHP